MTQKLKRLIVAGVFLLAAVIGGPVLAADVSAGALSLQQAWARASIGSAKAGAAYMTIVNRGDEVDRLLAVSTSAAKVSQLHTNLMKDGVMRMRQVEVLEIAPGEPVVLQPGGLHIMLMGLKKSLVEGGSFSLLLTFEKAGRVEVPVQIEAPNALEPGPDSSMPGDHVQGSRNLVCI